MSALLRQFVNDDSGAITVDWVVLSAAAVSMAIAATGVLRGSIDELASDLEAQLRTQQISDAFVQFTSAHFEPFYEASVLTEEQANELFLVANEKTNGELLSALQEGIAAMNNNELTPAEIAELTAIASVAYQRNIVDDGVIEQYFGDSVVQIS